MTISTLDAIRITILSLTYSEMMDLSEDIDTIVTASNDESLVGFRDGADAVPAIASNLAKWARGDWDSVSPPLVVSMRSPEVIPRHPPPIENPTGKVVLMFEQMKAEFGIPFSMPKLKQMGEAGTFPKPMQIGSKRVAWVKTEVEAWIASRAAERKN